MNKRRAASDRLTYAYVTILNICVVGMFLMVLTPQPTIPKIEASVAGPHIAKQVKAVTHAPIVGTPTRVVVPSVNIDVAVRPGTYNVDTQSWTIDHHSAFHADITVPVNDTNGTTLIYGHAGWGIFNFLAEVGDGAVAYVYTAEGYRFTYDFESNRRVDPSDVSALTSTGPPRLVMQTCSGAFDAYRTLVTFSYKEAIRE